MASSSSSSSSSVPPAASLTADDLIRIFNDPEGELLNYKHKMAEVPTTKVDDIFHMEVPFDAIKEQVMAVRKDIFDKLDPNTPAPTFEHVGSTAIRGMPGALSPDILIIEEHFPPSASTVRAVVGAGFQFMSLAPHGINDYWFKKPIPEDHIGPKRSVVLHLVDRANPTGRTIIKLRDACNNDPAAFEEYKASKLAARSGSYADYKFGKARGGLIERLRKEEGLPPSQ